MKNTLRLFFLLLVFYTSLSFIGWLLFNKYYWFMNTYMWSPALATFTTLILQRKNIQESLPWKWMDYKSMFQTFMIPFLYAFAAYFIGYLVGFGEFGGFDKRVDKMGIGQNYSWLVIFLFATIWGLLGTLYNMASSLGEEIGWRGFLLPKLLKSKHHVWVTIIVGTIWAVWHFPLIIVNTSQMDTIPWLVYLSFWLGLVGISFIYTYYYIKTRSLWTAVILHSAHNYFVLNYFGNLTVSNDLTGTYLGESGIFFALVTILFGVYFAIKTNRLKHEA